MHLVVKIRYWNSLPEFSPSPPLISDTQLRLRAAFQNWSACGQDRKSVSQQTRWWRNERLRRRVQGGTGRCRHSAQDTSRPETPAGRWGVGGEGRDRPCAPPCPPAAAALCRGRRGQRKGVDRLLLFCLAGPQSAAQWGEAAGRGARRRAAAVPAVPRRARLGSARLCSAGGREGDEGRPRRGACAAGGREGDEGRPRAASVPRALAVRRRQCSQRCRAGVAGLKWRACRTLIAFSCFFSQPSLWRVLSRKHLWIFVAEVEIIILEINAGVR